MAPIKNSPKKEPKLASFNRAKTAPIKGGCFRVENSLLRRTKTGPKMEPKLALFQQCQNGPIKRGPAEGHNFGPFLGAKLALLKLLCSME